MPRRILDNPHARAAAHRDIDAAPDGYEANIVAPNKTRAQEEAYHAIFGEVAKQCQHLNQCFDLEGWKRLLVDQFRSDMLADPECHPDIRENLEGSVKMVPSLDGRSIVSIGLQTRKFRRRTAAAFLDWLNAWCVEHDAKLSAPARMFDEREAARSK